MVALAGRKTLALTANVEEVPVDGILQVGTKELTMTSPGRIDREGYAALHPEAAAFWKLRIAGAG